MLLVICTFHFSDVNLLLISFRQSTFVMNSLSFFCLSGISLLPLLNDNLVRKYNSSLVQAVSIQYSFLLSFLSPFWLHTSYYLDLCCFVASFNRRCLFHVNFQNFQNKVVHNIIYIGRICRYVFFVILVIGNL